jgi:hypothetical protein
MYKCRKKWDETKSMITAGNGYFYSLKQIFGPRVMSKLVKINLLTKMENKNKSGVQGAIQRSRHRDRY